MPFPRRSSPAATPGWTPRSRSRSIDRKSTRLNSSHLGISYAVFCLKKKRLRVASYSSTTRTVDGRKYPPRLFPVVTRACHHGHAHRVLAHRLHLRIVLCTYNREGH